MRSEIDDIIRQWAGATFDESMLKENGLRRLARAGFLAGLEAAVKVADDSRDHDDDDYTVVDHIATAIRSLAKEAT